MSILSKKITASKLLPQLFKRYFLRFFLFTLYTLLILEILLRLTYYASVVLYVKKYIPEEYQKSLKQIYLFQAKGYPDWSKFDPICYTLPKDNLFFRSHFKLGPCSYPLEKEKDEIRIMCLGDSVTYGSGNYDKTYPYILEQLLRKNYPDKKINVLNAGIDGANPRQIKRTFQFHLVHYLPDILIIRVGIGLTDSYEVSKYANIFRYNLWRILFHSRIFRIICAARDRIKPARITTADQVYDLIMKNCSPEEVKPKKFTSDIAIIQDIARTHQIPHIITLDYLSWDKESNNVSSGHDQYKTNELDHLIKTVIDFKEALKNCSTKDLFLDGCHITTQGNTIIANKIFQFIIKEKWIK